MRSYRNLSLSSLALVLAWVVAAPALASDDTWITTKIRIALMTTDGAGRNAVKVDTEHGKVTLNDGRQPGGQGQGASHGAGRGRRHGRPATCCRSCWSPSSTR